MGIPDDRAFSNLMFLNEEKYGDDSDRENPEHQMFLDSQPRKVLTEQEIEKIVRAAYPFPPLEARTEPGEIDRICTKRRHFRYQLRNEAFAEVGADLYMAGHLSLETDF